MPYDNDRPSPVPLPTGLVVKNGSNMRPIFSLAMPWPLSDTSTQTAAAAGSVPVRIVILPRSAVMACAAFTSRFMKTWFSSEGRQKTSGRVPYSFTTSAVYLISLLTMLSVESMPWCRSDQAHS